MKNSLWAGVLVAALLPLTAIADGIPVTPGLWDMNFTMQMPMLPQPQVIQKQECVEEEELSPDEFEMDEESNCAVSDFVMDGNTMQWSLACDGEMGKMQGHWSFTSDGDSMHGEGTMNIDAGGQAMEMVMNWQGKRIGDCDPAQSAQ